MELHNTEILNLIFSMLTFYCLSTPHQKDNQQKKEKQQRSNKKYNFC